MNSHESERIDRRMIAGETEQRILDGTIELLDSGASLAGLSVNRIVETAGVSRATFYLHFGDKRALVARLAATELQEFQRITAGFLADPDAGRSALGEAVEDLVGLWRAHAGVLSSLIELAEYDADTREDWQSVVRSIAGSIAGALSERDPSLPAETVATMAEIVAWMGERAVHQMVGRDATDAQATLVVEGLTELLWRMLEPASSLPG